MKACLQEEGRFERHMVGVQCAWGKVSLTTVQPCVNYYSVGPCALTTIVSGSVH